MLYQSKIHIFLSITLIAFMLANCGTTPPPRQVSFPPLAAKKPVTRSAVTIQPAEVLPPPKATAIPSQDPARNLINSGRYLDAALVLAELAKTMPTPNRQNYQLRVISLLLQGNYIQQADQIVNETNVTGLDSQFYVRKTMLAAQVALAKHLPEQAITSLNSVIYEIQSVDLTQQREFHRMRIDAYTTLNNFVGAAQARVALEPILTDATEILENQETLLRDLQQLDANQLASLRDDANSDVLRGWLSLAYIAKISADEQQAQQQISEWQQNFTVHPVQSSIIETLLAKQPQALGRPTQIAVILPMSGRFAKAARAIRNGFLAAYYAKQPGDQPRPTLTFYDEGTNPDNIESVYQQAIDDGVDFVVGPLNKRAVAKLATYPDLQGAVLTLNYGAITESTPGNFFQMSLSPEQEARHVAEHAWLDGHTNSAAIYPKTSWGKRVFNAFRDRWEELGGTIVEHQTYDIKKNDYAIPIKRLLNIDESESRHSELRKILRRKIIYEPRRRKDIDFIFMAAFSRQGRLIRPQLKFHRASDIPVYATSHVFSGALKPDMDRDINGVQFSDMPWTLITDPEVSQLKQQISNAWPKSAKRYIRLYALGIDAYSVIPELNRLRRNRFASFQGETGVLYLDIDNRLQRRLLWAQFTRGVPKVLDNY